MCYMTRHTTHAVRQILQTQLSTYHQLHHLHISNGAVRWSSHLEKPNKRHELCHLNTTNSIIYIPPTPSSTYTTKCNGRMAVSHGQIQKISRTLSSKHHESITYIPSSTYTTKRSSRMAVSNGKNWANVTNTIIKIPQTQLSTYHQLRLLQISRNRAVRWPSRTNKRHELDHPNITNSIIYVPPTQSSTCITKRSSWMAVSHGKIEQMPRTLSSKCRKLCSRNVTNSIIYILRHRTVGLPFYMEKLNTRYELYHQNDANSVRHELNHVHFTSHHECRELYHQQFTNSACYLSRTRPSVSHESSWMSRTLSSTYRKLCSLYIMISTIYISRIIIHVTNSTNYNSQTLLVIHHELDHLYLTDHHKCHELYYLNTANSARYLSRTRPSV